MVVGKKRKQLTAEQILSLITPYDIYRYYMGEDFRIGKVMCSPMPGRGDKHPSFMVNSKNGVLLHEDFADSRFNGNCFQFVMQKEMIPDFNTALARIDKDFNLGISSSPIPNRIIPIYNQPILKDKEPKFFQVQYSTKFVKEERDYWNQFYISEEECKLYEIFGLRRYWIDRKKQPMRKGELAFAYRLGSWWKIYRPYGDKDRKWITNIPNSSIEGIEGISKAERGVITKARKDRVVLRKFLSNVVSVQNESLQALSLENMGILWENWDSPYLNYDADEAGKKNSWIVTERYALKHVNTPDNYLPQVKDFAGMIQAYGPDAVYKYLQSKNIVS